MDATQINEEWEDIVDYAWRYLNIAKEDIQII